MKLLNHTLSYLSIAFFLVIGVWAAFFYFNMLDEIHDSIDDGLENSKILIIQKAQADSTIIHRTNFMESNYTIHEITAERAHSFEDIYIDSALYMANEGDYEPVRILKSVFRGQGDRFYELHVMSSTVEEDDLVKELFYSILWLYAILLASILAVNNVLLKKIWKPFYQILERLRRFSIESPDPLPVSQTKVTEFRMLNESVTALLDRTVATFNSQKQFIENASHELQTPLAIAINNLELIVEKETIPDAELAKISTVIQSLERLTRLNKTLLLLSRIENHQFPEKTTVNLNEVTDRAISGLADLAEYKSVTVSCVHESALVCEMNPELASIMITNLLKNGLVHNFEGGSLNVIINFSGISVENTSHSPALDPSRIFTRFYKDPASNTSTGLGLAIVRSIAQHYGFFVQYAFSGKHVFSIKTTAS